MKSMHILSFLLLIAAVASPSFATETVSEKAAVKGRAVKREMKKGAHRVNEAFCTEGDAKCAMKKAGHRVQEESEEMVDKTKELKDKMD